MQITNIYQSRLAKLKSTFSDRRTVIIIVVLGAVLSLDSADLGALSATANQIQNYFHISKTAFGLLGTISTGIGALATLPFGVFIDRTNRSRLLARCVVLWGLAMLLSGLSINFGMLIFSRVLLGVLTAVAYPAIASLIGDYFPSAKRGKAYGWILSGDLIGAGFGVTIAGEAAALFHSWRAAEFVLALPAALVALAVFRMHEPARSTSSENPQGKGISAINPMIKKQGLEADSSAVLKRDPKNMSLLTAVRYILKIRTNLVIIVATALGYFFFTGLRYFALQFAMQHYKISHATASAFVLFIGLGALVGVIVGGRASDWWVKLGHYKGRITIPAITYSLTALALATGVYTKSLGLAILLFIAAAFFFECSNPPLDAARLDIMFPSLWGRAEATRTVFRGGVSAIAPVMFGFTADRLFPGNNSLEYTILLMLIPLFIASLVLLIGRRTYGRDVLTADRTREQVKTAARPAIDTAIG